MSDTTYTVMPSEFVSKGCRCRGDLYLPDGVTRPPVIVMAHGFAAERTFGLPAYAARFARTGMAVFLFDYRTFGDSEGTPRNYVDPARHLADWQMAIAHVRSLDAVDSGRIGLWGSSFSGGHVIVTAARDASITAIVAQVPFVDSISTIRKLGLGFLLKASLHATFDILCLMTFQSPHCVKVIGHPDEFAVMNTPESYPGFLALIPEDSHWENRCPARILMTFAGYRPIASARKIKCPALIMLAENDSLIDASAVEKTAVAMENGTLIKYPIGHFDIYSGPSFEDAVRHQTDFFLTHLTREEPIPFMM